ncbi:LysR family transcriptional regulator [Alcaligenaceae bacterium]|nr:LysR family transcriptional regulator [Alcaligenaceae bacterium]
MNLTIKQLRVFVAVFEARSFTVAAANLCMTQSAISKVCRQLEERVDCQLFDRSSRLLVPLDGAHALYRPALDILASVTVAERRLGSLKSMEQGRLNVTASTLIMYALVTPAVSKFHDDYPGVQLELFELPTIDGVEHILNGTVDLGLVSLIEPHPKIESEVIYESTVWVACAPSHPITSSGPLSLHSLLDYRHIGLRKIYGFEQGVDKIFHDLGKKPQAVNIDSGTLLSSLALARDGLGIVIIPSYIVGLARSLGLTALRVESDVIVHRLSLAHRVGAWLSPAARHFIEVLKRVIPPN